MSLGEQLLQYKKYINTREDIKRARKILDGIPFGIEEDIYYTVAVLIDKLDGLETRAKEELSKIENSMIDEYGRDWEE